VLVEDTDFWVEPETGFLHRLCSDWPVRWCADKIIVVYDAGFETVPADLAQAAMDFVKIRYLEQGRDPLVKSERTDIPGVMEKEVAYWMDTVPGNRAEGSVPGMVSAQLTRFRNPVFG
jgi:hypothetical protein